MAGRAFHDEEMPRNICVDFDENQSAEWMLGFVDGLKQEAAGDFEIALSIAKTAVLGQKLSAMRLIVSRQSMPGQVGASVMGEMQVVVQEQEREKGAGFDDGGTLEGGMQRLVFREGSNQDQTRTGHNQQE